MGERGDQWAEPVQRVTFAQPFYVSATEITFTQYDACCKARKWHCPADHDWGRGGRPVINVTWDDARVYADWLGRTTGSACRLPSEAE
jgi:serine/threonine-protein kinase PpkA